MSTVYRFNELIFPAKDGYVFQHVCGRKLSDICHSHDFFEIILVAAGECKKMINGKCYSAEKNDIIILSPENTHLFIEQSEDIAVISLSVRCEEFINICSAFGKDTVAFFEEKKPVVFHHPDFFIEFLTLFPNYREGLDKNQNVMLLAFIIERYLSAKNDRKDSIPKSLNDAMSRMNSTENIRGGLSTFLKLTNYSHSHLSRLMKKHFGISINGYISELRLGEAYRLLTTTEMPPEEISENVGYASYSHFSKIFKEKYGITPAMARKSHRMWTV